jgi:peptidoglycan-associated lipoprotein
MRQILPTVPCGGWLAFAPMGCGKDHPNFPTQIPGYAEGNEKMRFKLLTLAAAMTVLAACADKKTDTVATGAGTAAPVASGGIGTTDIRNEFMTKVGDRIFFAFDKSTISAEARAILERQAAFAKTNAQLTFTVEGHCDERGTREYNLALGERRATSDKNALVSLGVQASRLQTISYGKERPAVVGSNEAAWAQNRRAVTVIN